MPSIARGKRFAARLLLLVGSRLQCVNRPVRPAKRSWCGVGEPGVGIGGIALAGFEQA